MVALPLDDLIAELNAYVDPRRMPDFATTGLQVRGSATVSKVAFGVSANLDLFRAAADWGADLAVTHHGLFWESEDPESDPARRFDEARAAFLSERGVSLAAYHLPLDAHPEIGNNVEIARRLGLEIVAFDFGDLPETDAKVGLTARAAPPITPQELLSRTNRLFGQPSRLIAAGPAQIQTLAIVSGGAASDIYAAIDRSLDAYVTGEGREWIPALAREAGIHFFAVGHHASEVFGIQALGRFVTDRFGLETRFFPQSNPF